MFQNNTVEFSEKKKKKKKERAEFFKHLPCPTDFCIIDIGVYYEGKSEIV